MVVGFVRFIRLFTASYPTLPSPDSVDADQVEAPIGTLSSPENSNPSKFNLI